MELKAELLGGDCDGGDWQGPGHVHSRGEFQPIRMQYFYVDQSECSISVLTNYVKISHKCNPQVTGNSVVVTARVSALVGGASERGGRSAD